MFKTFQKLQLFPLCCEEADHTNCVACLDTNNNRLKSESIYLQRTLPVCMFDIPGSLLLLYSGTYFSSSIGIRKSIWKQAIKTKLTLQRSAPNFLLLIASVCLVGEREGTVPGWLMLAPSPSSVLLWMESGHHWGDHLCLVPATLVYVHAC